MSLLFKSCVTLVLIILEIRAEIRVNLRLFYDSAFFSANSGLPDRCEEQLTNLISLVNNVFSVKSLGDFNVRFVVEGHPRHFLGDKWFASKATLREISTTFVKSKDSHQWIHQNIFVTRHGINQWYYSRSDL